MFLTVYQTEWTSEVLKVLRLADLVLTGCRGRRRLRRPVEPGRGLPVPPGPTKAVAGAGGAAAVGLTPGSLTSFLTASLVSPPLRPPLQYSLSQVESQRASDVWEPEMVVLDVFSS